MSLDDERSSSEDEIPVESLVQGREKRSTAGRQMSALIDAAADDELALLFEEVEDDNEFADDAVEGGWEEEDLGLDSSSDDDDDQGPNAQADDFEGERQIEKEEKEEKKKKRVREDLRYKIASKKVKIDPTAPNAVSTTPAPRPRKKSERVSWIPTPDEGPTRSSSRRQTMHNKELTHARLKDSEEKRIRLIATMEEAAKRKAKRKPKQMTQAEHLAEAERVEKHNSKSLNRWEEAEKRKAEERRAKIEALQNRRLDGPVISYWSGVATWADGCLTRVGKVNITPKPEKEDTTRKKSKKADKDGKIETEQKSSIAGAELGISQTAPSTTQFENSAGLVPSTTEPNKTQISGQMPEPGALAADQETDTEMKNGQSNPGSEAPNPLKSNKPPSTSAESQAPASAPSVLPDSVPAASTDKANTVENEVTQVAAQQPAKVAEQGTVEGVSDALVNQDLTSQPAEASAVKDNKPVNPEILPDAEEKPSHVAQESIASPSPKTQSTPQPTTALPAPTVLPPPADRQPDQQENTQIPATIEQRPDIHVDEPTATAEDTPQPAAPPKVVEHTGRCLTVLENFDDKTAQSRDFNIYFNAKKPPRLTKISSSLCVITSLPSRYRDPDTSLPFANSYAYHEIRHTAAQKYHWSTMLGCYVGPNGVAARGVPERFLDPNAKPSSPKKSSVDAEPNTSGKEGETTKPVDSSNPTTSTPTPMPTPNTAPMPTVPPAAAAPAPATAATAGAGDAMDID
ncbi:YL1 nuclear protein-domain-containing protein, partial [Aspergillus spectabilis]